MEYDILQFYRRFLEQARDPIYQKEKKMRSKEQILRDAEVLSSEMTLEVLLDIRELMTEVHRVTVNPMICYNTETGEVEQPMTDFLSWKIKNTTAEEMIKIARENENPPTGNVEP